MITIVAAGDKIQNERLVRKHLTLVVAINQKLHAYQNSDRERLNFPAEQSMQSTEPPLEYFPLSQGMQCVAPVMLLVWSPPLQYRQLLV
jgi:hypothetical protein